VVNDFKKQHCIEDITIVADAAMMSSSNLQALAEAGYHYIIGSRLHKIPYGIAEYQKTKDLTDNQIITTQLDSQRVIYQYRAKRAALDLRNIEKQIEKAKKIVNGTATPKKAKFLTLTTRNRQLNQVLIDKAYALAGIKGYVTNLDIPDEKVINYYHQLWRVEQSFRMAKSDLKARPIFHYKRDSIEAHLTIVFTALALSRIIENLTGLSIKQFVKTLRPLRSGVITINGKEYMANAEISSPAKEIMDKLFSA
jgi:transposase